MCSNVLFKFIYFWLCWVFVAVHMLSLAVESRGYRLGALQHVGSSHMRGLNRPPTLAGEFLTTRLQGKPNIQQC